MSNTTVKTFNEKGKLFFMRKLLQNDAFFKVLFDVIPVLSLIVNIDGRVYSVNHAAKNLLGVTDEAVYLQNGGDVLHCIHTKDDPNGCGFGRACKSCVVRNTAMEAISGYSTHRTKGQFEVLLGDTIKQLNLLVSAAPFEYQGNKFAILILEDISLITELEGLLPICASCKSIRDDKGYWNRLEKYIQEHSEADFTHSFCPDCIKKLYPDYYDKIVQYLVEE